MTKSDSGLLAPYRVLDLTDAKGWSCGRLLGDLGADVVKVEPPGGDPGRKSGAFYRDEGEPDKNLGWMAYNANKRGVTLNLDLDRGRELFRQLARRADFVIESFSPGYLGSRGIGYTDLRELNPAVILTSITPFGQTGPRSQYRGSDLTATAASGFMSLVGEPDREPLRVSLPQAPMWAGMYATAGTLIAHYQRLRTGRGQHVDVSMQASMLWALANAPAYWSLNRESLKRGGNYMVGRSITGAKMRAVYPCKDGHINFILYGGEAGKRSNEALVEWMVERNAAPDWLKQKDWGAFNVATSTQAEVDALEKVFVDFLSQWTKEEFAGEAVKRGILGYPVNNARDIRNDPQLIARDFWQKVPHDHLGAALTFPGIFAKFSKAETKIRRRAPGIGEHNEEILGGELGLTQAERGRLKVEGVI
jgi:crotonobetainyl-CoA:carnitine CoA-transferase CaiB-like acyl-CoA transferase